MVADTVKGPLYGVDKATYGGGRGGAASAGMADTLRRMAAVQMVRAAASGGGKEGGKQQGQQPQGYQAPRPLDEQGYVLYKRAFKVAQSVAMEVREDYNDGFNYESEGCDDDQDEHGSLRRVLEAENIAAQTMFDCAVAAEGLSRYPDAAVLYGRASDLLMAVEEEWQSVPRAKLHGQSKASPGGIGAGGVSMMIQEARHKAALFVAISGKNA
jgi:hypothetical protein